MIMFCYSSTTNCSRSHHFRATCKLRLRRPRFSELEADYLWWLRVDLTELIEAPTSTPCLPKRTTCREAVSTWILPKKRSMRKITTTLQTLRVRALAATHSTSIKLRVFSHLIPPRKTKLLRRMIELSEQPDKDLKLAASSIWGII